MRQVFDILVRLNRSGAG